MFGLTGNEGNHGEDVKELYYYLDNTPSHSYMKHLYKYPQAVYPYEELVQGNLSRSKFDPEFEISDTGIFNEGKYFDVFTEYAKNDTEDILIRISIHNRGEQEAWISLLPVLWFRNLWSFNLAENKPSLQLEETAGDYGEVKVTDYAPANIISILKNRCERFLQTTKQIKKDCMDRTIQRHL